MPIPPLLCFGLFGHNGLLGKCSGRFSSNVFGEIRAGGRLLAGECVDLFPLLACLVSYSNHCRESGAESFGLPPSSGLVCSECNGKPVSSGALTSMRIPEVDVSGVPGFKGGVLIRLASCKKTVSFCELMSASQHLQKLSTI